MLLAPARCCMCGVVYFVKPPVLCAEDHGKHHMFTGYVKCNVQLTKHLHLSRHSFPSTLAFSFYLP